MNHPPDYGHLTWIGTILGPHGLKGEVRVRPLTDTPDYYLQEKEFLLESGEGLKRVEVLERQRPSGFFQKNFLLPPDLLIQKHEWQLVDGVLQIRMILKADQKDSKLLLD